MITRSSEQALARRLSRNCSAIWTLLRWWARFICRWRSIAYINTVGITWQPMVSVLFVTLYSDVA